MKPKRLKRLATALAIAGVSAVLVGCGSHNDSATAPIITNPNGTWPNGTLPGGGGCAPITGAIPFTGQGIYYSGTSVAGGQIPGGQAAGQVVIGGTAAGGQYSRNAVDLMISMNILPAGYNGTLPGGYNPYQGYGQQPGVSNVQGVIQIQPATQQEIINQFGGGYGTGLPGQIPGQLPLPGQLPGQIPGQYGQGPCVSGIAFQSGIYQNILYAGMVYLYLNGTTHGVSYPL